MELDALRRIESESDLRTIIGDPLPVVRSKITTSVNSATRLFVERSPFVLLATSSKDGRCDVSPRGDPAGFVRILNDQTLLVPERPGNKLADTLLNIISNGHIGILFVVPGVGDTFRVNGRAFLTDDAALLEPSAVEERVPKLGIVVEIEEAYTQCSKAFLRSDLWNPEGFQDRSTFPTGGEIMRVINGESFDAGAYDVQRNERYARRDGFY